MSAAREFEKVDGPRQPFMQIIRRHCVPLHVVSPDKSAKHFAGWKFTGGSALLWESVEGRFFVTAQHVWKELMGLVQSDPLKYMLVTYDSDGPVRIELPILVDESEELDLAVFTVKGIKDFTFDGKEFLRALTWPTPPAQDGEMIVGCGYPGAERLFRKGKFENRLFFWAHMHCSVSSSGTRLLLDGQVGRSKFGYFTETKPKGLSLPGISGAPLFALRHTLDWVGVVRSGCGDLEGYSIMATPSSFIGADGRIQKP